MARTGTARVAEEVEKAAQTRSPLKAVEQPERRGDPDLTREAMSLWKEGQRRCRARKRHNWMPFTVYEHRPNRLSHGRPWYEVIEQCSQCKNKRTADFVQTNFGLRIVDKWKPLYKDGYLLPRGAMGIDEDIRDELVASDILSRRIVEALDDDEEDI